jgi:hypothetical protein
VITDTQARYFGTPVNDHTLALAVQLQPEGAEAFDMSWEDLPECIASKGEALK